MRRARYRLCLLLPCLLAGLACTPDPGSEKPPSLLLITAEGSSLGALPEGPGVWSGFAIAASGARRPAAASLLTGLRPWQHQLLEETTPTLGAGALPPAAVLRELGYRTVASSPSGPAAPGRGWKALLAGFDQVEGAPSAAVEALDSADSAPVFAWLHLSRGVEPPRELLAAVPAEVLVVATGVPGPGTASLDREAIEHPLWIRLPPGRALPSLAPEPGRRVAQRRIWATLLEAAGGRPAPAHAPSLFRRASPEILSELYGVAGAHRYSLLAGDLQLLWELAYAAPGGARNRRALLRSPPLHGLGVATPKIRLSRWREGGSDPVDDPAAASRLAASLERRWQAFTGGERSPREELRARAAPAPEGAREEAERTSGR